MYKKIISKTTFVFLFSRVQIFAGTNFCSAFKFALSLHFPKPQFTNSIRFVNFAMKRKLNVQPAYYSYR